ncbi:hypothetical protein EMCRGX_G021304 [Ephydatia muelleri]
MAWGLPRSWALRSPRRLTIRFIDVGCLNALKITAYWCQMALSIPEGTYWHRQKIHFTRISASGICSARETAQPGWSHRRHHSS